MAYIHTHTDTFPISELLGQSKDSAGAVEAQTTQLVMKEMPPGLREL